MAASMMKSLRAVQHARRPYTLCRSRLYLQLMAEAKAEYDAMVERGAIPRGKQTRAEARNNPRPKSPNLFHRGMRVNNKVANNPPPR